MAAVHFRNLETVRLIAASSVIFSHAFLIASGSEAGEPFRQLTGSILGGLGLQVFFIISGLLVSQSLERSSGIASYLWKRFLRIYPGYLVCVAICAVVVMAAFSPLGAGGYLSSLGWMKPLWHLSTFQVLKNTGVSFYEGDLGAVLNGSLWSIPVEIFCYLLLAAVALAKLSQIWMLSLLLIAGTIFLFIVKEYPETYLFDIAWGIPPFAAGMLMYRLHRRAWRPDGWVVAAGAAILIVLAGTHTMDWLAPLPLAAIVLFVATRPAINLGNAAAFGDFSFGTYLYGWPIEQMLRAVFGPTSPWLLFIVAAPLAILAGALSWHLVEKLALQLKSPGLLWGRIEGDGQY